MKRALKRTPVKTAPKKNFSTKRTNSYARPKEETSSRRRVEHLESSSKNRNESRSSSFGKNSIKPASTFRDRSSKSRVSSFSVRGSSRSKISFNDRGQSHTKSSFGRDRSNVRGNSTFRDRTESRVTSQNNDSNANGPAPIVSFYQNEHSSSYRRESRSSTQRSSSSKYSGSLRTRSSFGGGSSRLSGGRGKRGFKGSYIDERMFVNKGTKTTEMQDYEPKHAFADFEIADSLAKNLVKRGYIKPSPIQDQSIPVTLEGKDVIGIAATGTGKTAAFLIPLINKIEKDRNQKVMILTPTRELAMQIQKEFFDFTEGMKLYSVTCVGGSPIYPQIKQLGLGVHVVVGTPGRVKDLIARGKIKMSNYESIVLDEADRMLDMGFIDDMTEILSLMPKSKQALFFSATFNDKVKALCGNFLKNPVTISVKTRDTSGSVDQDVVRIISKSQKIDQLHEILNREEATKVLIFREMKRSVDELTDELTGRGIKALGLHGDMRNRERERAVHALKEGHVKVLIATDVAARGIHISDISHVINYDIPNDYETYIHRIGRTGRGEAKGIALTFI